MKHFFFLLSILLSCTLTQAQDTLFTKSIQGAGSRNLSVTNPVYANGKIVFFTSNPIDSVAAPDMKMVTLDTCGNVEKITSIPLEGHWGVNFFGGLTTFPTTLIVSSDNEFLISGYQPLNSLNNDSQLLFHKIDKNGKITLVEKLPHEAHRQETLQLLETADGYYIGGLSWGDGVLDLYPFVFKIGKNGEKWYKYTTFPLDMRLINDTLSLLDGNVLTKLNPNNGKEISIFNNQKEIGYIRLSKFISDETVIHFGQEYYTDSLNNLRTALFFTTTDNNYINKTPTLKIPAIISEIDEYYNDVHINSLDESSILSTSLNDSKQIFPNYLLIRKIDKNGNVLWIRADTITHQGAYQHYDVDLGWIHLPFGNTMGLIWSQINYINDKTNIIYEVRIVKFDSKGREILGKCNMITANQIKNNTSIEVYPNPFNDELNIKMPENMTSYEFHLFDTTGKIVQQTIFQGNILNVKRNNLPSGIYFYQIINENAIVASGKVIAE